MALSWYSVRTIVCFPNDGEKPGHDRYEERITLWKSESFDDAIVMAEEESTDYARTLGAERTEIAQAYLMDEIPGHGNEVFSLMRDSDLSKDEYIDRYFATGSERQEHTK